MEDFKTTQNNETLIDLLGTVSELFHIRIQEIDHHLIDGLSVINPKEESYCNTIRDRLGLKANCRKQQNEQVKKTFEAQESVCYTCHGGLTHILYPLYDEAKLFSIVTVSELRTLTAQPAAIKYLWDVNADSPDLLRKNFLRIPYFRDYDIANITRLLSDVKNLFFSSRPHYVTVPRTVEDIVEHMRLHYQERLSLSEAAELINKSSSRTSHLFHEVLGKSFKDVQADIIIEKAESIIHSQPSIQVQELAGQLGFKDSFYFSKFYKKQRGQTISQFKRSLD